MAHKGDSYSKQVAKKGKKPALISDYQLVNGFTKLSSSSGDLMEFHMKKKVDPRGPRKPQGKKVVTL